jgi:hypothetical protein
MRLVIKERQTFKTKSSGIDNLSMRVNVTLTIVGKSERLLCLHKEVERHFHRLLSYCRSTLLRFLTASLNMLSQSISGEERATAYSGP